MKLDKMIMWFWLAMIQASVWIFFTLFVNWWAPVFCDEKGNLPWWMKWVQPFDATLDEGHVRGYFKTEYQYLWRMFYLYRNTAAGFGYYELGIPFAPKKWTINRYEIISGGFIFEATSNDGFWNYRYSNIWFACETGWKAWNMTDDTETGFKKTSWGPMWRIPITISVTINVKNLWSMVKGDL